MTKTLASWLPLIGAAHFSFTPVDPDKIVSMAQAVGAQVLRVEIFWQDCELVRGQYVMPPNVAALLGALKAADIRPLVLLDYGNRLYSGSGAWNLPPRDDESCRAYARWAAWVVIQVAQACGFEIYNEPNNPVFWASAPNPAQFARLLSAALPAMHAINPKAVLMPGGVGGCNGRWGDAAVYMTAVCKAMTPEAVKLLRGYTIHPYNSVGGAETLLAFLRDFSQRTPDLEHRFAVTEMGVEADWIGADEERRAIYEAQMPLYAIASGAVWLLTSYSLIDSGPDPKNQQMTYGLFRHDGTPKPAVAARRAVMDALAGCETFEVTMLADGAHELAVHKATGTTTIAWSPGVMPAIKAA